MYVLTDMGCTSPTGVERVTGRAPQISSQCARWCDNTALSGVCGPDESCVYVWDGSASAWGCAARGVYLSYGGSCSCPYCAASVLGCTTLVVSLIACWEVLLVICAVCTKDGEVWDLGSPG